MKNKITLLCLMLILTDWLHAADSTAVKPYKRVYAGVSFTPSVAYRYLTGTVVSNRYGPNTDERVWRNKHEHTEFGFMLGGRLGVNITRHLSFETGLEYYRHRYSYKTGSFRLTSAWVPPGYDTISTNNRGEILKDFQYLNIPVQFNFMAGKRKLKAIFALGANIQLQLKATERHRLYLRDQLYSNFVFDNTWATNSLLNVAPFLGVGAHWNISRSFAVRLMPYAQMQVFPGNDGNIKEYLWSFGVNVSAFIGFVRVK